MLFITLASLDFIFGQTCLKKKKYPAWAAFCKPVAISTDWLRQIGFETQNLNTLALPLPPPTSQQLWSATAAAEMLHAEGNGTKTATGCHGAVNVKHSSPYKVFLSVSNEKQMGYMGRRLHVGDKSLFQAIDSLMEYKQQQRRDGWSRAVVFQPSWCCKPLIEFAFGDAPTIKLFGCHSITHRCYR